GYLHLHFAVGKRTHAERQAGDRAINKNLPGYEKNLSKSVLFYHQHFGNYSFGVVRISRTRAKYQIDSCGGAPSVVVFSIPNCLPAVCGRLVNQLPADIGYFHIGVSGQTFDSDWAFIVRTNGIGKNNHFRTVDHSALYRICPERLKPAVGSDKYFPGSLVDSKVNDIVVKKRAVIFIKSGDLYKSRGILHKKSVGGAKPFSVCAVHGNGAHVFTLQQILQISAHLDRTQ